ncbi:RNA-binding, RBD [Glarea lozoyensis ATCC 20868]|uniref:RNA-binding, RBD n=1 Tax=Glarea lozoyensis (strain ATCC 20868 / MF5171) TaxID=1116229 RepID=S3CKB8_GLAL2|nr:RNA-binding, RBD [Glarea lozoyensis ATCC 20868]EPE26190.1 RNA-binding, RBD [Glarea lozoyensis ATCC 20868]
MSTKPPSKSVFVGNIPYGLTEEQIIDIFSTAGQVLNFRLVYDKDTGRPKGFGFAEYPDTDCASSAVRNLNDYEIMNRKLRVDFSNDAGGDDDNNNSNNNYNNNNNSYQPPPPPNGMHMGQPPNNANSSSLPPLPVGIDLPPNLSCPDAISRTLHTLPPAQLLDVLSQMKTLATTDPAKATELLNQAPQLSYAIFQALLLMGLVESEALASVVQSNAPAPAPAPVPTPQQGYPPQPASGYPAGYPPPPPHMSGQLGMPMGSTPTQAHSMYAPPPAQHRPPPVQQQPQNPEADALMQQVLAMPQEMIDSLPPNDRAQLMALRASYGR